MQTSVLREQAEALNFLAWGELGDARQRTGLLTNRATRAEQAARKAFVIRKQLDGVSADDTLCFQADWPRMQQLAGASLAAATNFFNMLAVAAGQELPELLISLRQAVGETAGIAGAGKKLEARKREREFLAPFVAIEQPRLRSHVPSLVGAVGRRTGIEPSAGPPHDRPDCEEHPSIEVVP